METMVEICRMDDSALRARVLELKRELLSLRFQKAANQLKNVRGVVQARRSLARVKTVLSMRSQSARKD